MTEIELHIKKSRFSVKSDLRNESVLTEAICFALKRDFLKWNFILVTRFHSLNRDITLIWDFLNRDFTVLQKPPPGYDSSVIEAISGKFWGGPISGVRCISKEKEYSMDLDDICSNVMV